MRKFLKPALYLLLVPASLWVADQNHGDSDVVQSIIIVTSVIATAIFVRLNRPLPQLNPESLVKCQIGRLVASYRATSKMLKHIAVAVFVTLAYSIFLLIPLRNLSSCSTLLSKAPDVILYVLFGYILIRSFDAIKLDLSFVDLQSDLLIDEAIQEAEKRSKRSDEMAKAVKNPEGYGEVIPPGEIIDNKKE